MADYYDRIFGPEQAEILRAVEKELTEDFNYIIDEKFQSILARGFIEGKAFVRDKFKATIDKNFEGILS